MGKADVVNMMLYLQHGKPFPERLHIKGKATEETLVGYMKYTGRKEAHIEKTKELSSSKESSYLDYTSRESARGKGEEVRTYTNKGWIENEKQREQFRKEVTECFHKDGDLCWIPVTSFKDYLTAQQYGLFSENDYAAIFSKVLPQFFKSVGLKEENMVWWMDYHTNKDHPHTHVVFTEKEKTRTNPKFTMKELERFKSLIFKEVYARERLIQGKNIEDLKLFSKKDTLYQEIKKEVSGTIKKRNEKEITEKMMMLFEKLDNEKGLHGNRLQYNSYHMNAYRQEVDEIVELVLKHPNLKSNLEEFEEICNQLDRVKTDRLTTEYHSIRDAEMKKIRSFIGNQILQEKKNIMENYVEANIGTMPIENYREIVAMQAGFDSYEEMYQEGIRIGNGYDKEPEGVSLQENTKGRTFDLEIELEEENFEETILMTGENDNEFEKNISIATSSVSWQNEHGKLAMSGRFTEKQMSGLIKNCDGHLKKVNAELQHELEDALEEYYRKEGNQYDY